MEDNMSTKDNMRDPPMAAVEVLPPLLPHIGKQPIAKSDSATDHTVWKTIMYRGITMNILEFIVDEFLDLKEKV